MANHSSEPLMCTIVTLKMKLASPQGRGKFWNLKIDQQYAFQVSEVQLGLDM